ncbi:MAG: hypothetical protein J6C98_09635 [Oscillospiraceae bacterium]|nr:hypothetical protein [Oscillospiraceae bacterium]
MRETTDLYRQIQAGDHWAETRLTIGESGRLIDEYGSTITFGGAAVSVGSSGADSGFGEDKLISVSTSSRMFSQEGIAVGSCVSGEIDVELIKPAGEIVRMARLVPYVRITDGEQHSEWIQKGVYYIDTREENSDDSGIMIFKLHGYDAMLKAEADYPESALDWPAADIDVVREIAAFMDVALDPRTVDAMTKAYPVQYPGEYSCREVLGYIAAMYCGCFVMSDLGELRLITLGGMPVETRYLIESSGSAITFGGDRILV